MSFFDVFVILILLAIGLIYIKKNYAEVEYVVSKIDNKKYLVLTLPDKQEAADTLALLNKDMLDLIDYLTKKHPDDPVVQRLKKNYDSNNISEGSPYSGYTSYTVNKGQKLVLCIRQKNKSKQLIKDRNLLRYVVFHEAGHYASKTVGHNKEFWTNFKFIIKEAVEAGLYTKTNYKENPQPYCGITVSSSII
jgi:predicted metal-dependent hydrolase